MRGNKNIWAWLLIIAAAILAIVGWLTLAARSSSDGPAPTTSTKAASALPSATSLSLAPSQPPGEDQALWESRGYQVFRRKVSQVPNMGDMTVVGLQLKTPGGVFTAFLVNGVTDTVMFTLPSETLEQTGCVADQMVTPEVRVRMAQAAIDQAYTLPDSSFVLSSPGFATAPVGGTTCHRNLKHA